MEKKKTSGDEFERVKIEIPYHEYIKKTIGIFATGNYNKALYRFEEILDSYPDDVNANFYGGLCYFNLGKIEKAKLCFKNCVDHNFLNFTEEAEWYLAKCYLAEGNKEAAKTLLTKIANTKGFYAEQAGKLLKD
jgi:tetratricopeptide (TPR) repeat protein